MIMQETALYQKRGEGKMGLFGTATFELHSRSLHMSTRINGMMFRGVTMWGQV
jgi:hypothetical protein